MSEDCFIQVSINHRLAWRTVLRQALNVLGPAVILDHIAEELDTIAITEFSTTNSNSPTRAKRRLMRPDDKHSPYIRLYKMIGGHPYTITNIKFVARKIRVCATSTRNLINQQEAKRMKDHYE
jgi:hypothetical protein